MARTGRDSKVEEFLRMGGTKLPPGFAAKAKAATEPMRQRKLDAGRAVRKQGARLYGALKGASPIATKDPVNRKALDDLLGLHKKLAAKKLPFPKVGAAIGGFFPGVISGTVVPPFDFADTIPTVLAGPTPALSASASVNGQIGASVATLATPGFNGGGEFARVGIFFHPMRAGRLTISASPTYSFVWSTNSLNTSFVDSTGDVGLDIYGMNELGEIPASTGVTYESWQELGTGQIQFGYGVDVQKSMSVSLDVTPSLIYLCFVDVDASASGMGWPGSVATGKVSATVPSMSYEFVPQLVAESTT